MDFRYGREVTVGAVVLVAILAFVFGTMWLSGRSVGAEDLIHVQFSDVSGLKRASPVRVSGVQVGKVVEITFQDVGKVMVGISVPGQVKPKIDASAQIVSVSLVGDYAVDFNPGTSSAPLPQGQVIHGSQALGFTDKAAGLTDRADSVLIGAQAIMNEQTAKELHGTLQAMQRMLNTLSDRLPAPTVEATKTMASLRRLTDRLDTTLAQTNLEPTLRKLDTLTAASSAAMNRLAATSARLDSVLALVQHGEGSIGKFATDTAFYQNLVHLTATLDSVLADYRKHPGKIGVTVKLF